MTVSSGAAGHRAAEELEEDRRERDGEAGQAGGLVAGRGGHLLEGQRVFQRPL